MKKQWLIAALAVLLTGSCLCACSENAVPAPSEKSEEQKPAISNSAAEATEGKQNLNEAETEPELSVPTEIITNPEVNRLTGLPQEQTSAAHLRPLAVMIDNVQQAMPQRGLQSADLVYEIVTEGGITRLMAVFSDYRSIPAVGPVRSARDQHVQLMIPLDALYLHVGGSTYANDMLKQYSYNRKSINGYYQSGALELDDVRNQTADSEHCWFTSGELFSQAVIRHDLKTGAELKKAAFQFAPVQEKRILDGGSAKDIYLRFSGYANSEFLFDAETEQYVKYQFGEPHLDENTGSAVTFDNLIILFAEQEKYPGGILMHVNYAWGGVGWYFNGGRSEKIRWAKGNPEQPLRIVTRDGTETPVVINPGRTYIAVAGLDYYPHFRVDGECPEWKAE